MTDDSLGDVVLAGLRDFAQENALVLVGGTTFLLVLQTVRLWLRGSLAARRVARHRELGIAGEKRARKLLARSGFRFRNEQASGSYRLTVDGNSTDVHLRADFVVERQGQVYVAEVKSGVESVKVTGRGTRRQLLEYLLAFDVDGVLLVDMQSEQIREVRFPLLSG